MIDPNIKIEKEKNGRTRVRTINSQPSKTQQQFKEECDINNIIKKFSDTGEFLHLTKKQGVYADFSNIGDFHQMHQTVLEAQYAFDTLPAEMRLRFQNNPGNLIDFLQNPNNYDEGVKLGLLNPKPTTTQNQINEQNEQIKPKTKPKPPPEDPT